MSDNRDNSGQFADDMADYLQTFLDETEEQLDDLTETMLQLEKDHTSREDLNEAFRLIHSIKGSAAMMGLDNISRLTHHLENRFEQFRSGRENLDDPTMNVVLKCIDFLRECTSRLRSGEALGSATQLLGELKQLEKHADATEDSGQLQPVESKVVEAGPASTSESGEIKSRSPEEGQICLLIRFRDGLQLVDLKAELIVSRLSNVGSIAFTRPDREHLSELDELKEFEIHLQSDEEPEQLRAVVDVDGVESIEIRAEGAAGAETTSPHLRASTDHVPTTAEVEEYDETLVEPAATDEAAHEALTATNTTMPLVEKATVETRSPQTKRPDKSAGMPAAPKVSETMRVDIDRLDNLMNLAGELVVNRARFEQISGQVRPELRKAGMLNRIRDFSTDLQRLIERLENEEHSKGDTATQIQQLRDGLQLLTEQSQLWNNGRQYFGQIGDAIDQLTLVSHSLQRGVLDTRMVPIGPLFGRFKRVVRDLSKASNKQVTLAIRGEKTELDKRMIDELGDPLMHLVRNSIDHGLESAATRTASGKPEAGTVFLEATHSGNNVCIEVRDDGKGIDVDRIKSKLVERNLLSASEVQELSDEQALEYIWDPGFSTAQQVTDVSGRGVGMDVVKTRISQLNGTVQIQSSAGEGSRFTIRLPLTLAIITSLLVRMRGVTFAIPIDDVREIVPVDANDTVSVIGKRAINLRNEMIPLFNIQELFHWHGCNGSSNGDRRDKFEVVVLQSAGKTIGLTVDEFVGNQDIVIKSLSENFVKITGLSGASILGDGSVCLLLDVGAVIGMAIGSRTGDIAHG